MIIKSMSRKTGSFRQLLDYINKGEQRKNTAIFHNLKTDPDNLTYIAEEFENNAAYSPKRKNGVICYHEILALPSVAKQGNIPEILDDLARKYLELRAPEALAYAKAHLDTEHPHIHFCISGNKIKQKAKNRISKKDFSQIKQSLEHYKNKHYPEYVATKQTPTKAQKKSHKTPKMQHGACIKQEIAGKVSDIFRSSSSLPDALEQLEKTDITPYQRGRQVMYGVIVKKKKYRLSTLGIRGVIDERIEQWERTKKRLSELGRILDIKQREQVKDLTL